MDGPLTPLRIFARVSIRDTKMLWPTPYSYLLLLLRTFYFADWREVRLGAAG